jgi:hypothetical protein
MLLTIALLTAVVSTAQDESISEPSDYFDSGTDSPSASTEISPSQSTHGVSLTQTQQIIVYGAISATAVLILAEVALTVYCRKKNRRRIPVELEQVMLPSPDEAYGLAPL